MTAWALALLAWTLAGMTWWIIALTLAASPRSAAGAGACRDRRTLSIFKPIAGPIDDRERQRLARCLESFVRQLDANSELLLGIAEQDRARIEPLLESLRRRFPAAALRVIVGAHGRPYANGKVSMLKAMSRHANGKLWLWSDADIIAPPGSLEALRGAIAVAGTDFVTASYVLPHAADTAGLLDQLFVNVEIYPGAQLLARLDAIRFGFGSGVLFDAARFHDRVDWDLLGSSLADDYQLGRLLGRGRLATARFATLPGAGDWRGALLHYLRWQKTIRWCRPGAYAAQILVLPVVGWLAAVVASPASWVFWVGLGAAVSIDAVAAYAICASLSAPLGWRRLPIVAAWSVLRATVWVACWLPWPIVWRGQRWWTPRRLPEPGQRGELHADRRPGPG